MMRAACPLVADGSAQRLARAGLCLVLGLAASPASAAMPLDTDDTGTTPVGAVELEAAAEVAEHGGCGRDLTPGLVLHTGLGAALDLAVGFATTRAGGERRWTPLQPQVELKWRALEAAGARPGIGLRLGYDLGGLGGQDLLTHGVALRLLLAWQLGRHELLANLGATAGLPHGARPGWAALAGLAWVTGLREDLSIMGEVRAEAELPAGAPSFAALLGLAWEPIAGVVASAGGGPRGRPGAPPGWTALLGLTFALPAAPAAR